MLRVVADTNIYVSALVFGGKPREFLERAREGEFELAVSEDIIAEVAHVLRDRFGWPAEDVGDAYDVIVECTRRVEPTERLTVVAEDPANDRILECAAASGSRLLVSGDKHLLRLEAFEGVRIVSVGVTALDVEK